MTKWIIFSLTMWSIAHADMQKELNDFFERFGSQSNLSASGVYEGQKAGYMTGGGLTIRNQVMHNRPLTVNVPKFDAGCGGIDLYAGGFSFINSDQLVSTLKSVGSSSIGYAFLLGLETVSPQVANSIKNLQTWANNINSMNINSCEMAAGLVGSVWPQNTQASQHVCKNLGGQQGLFDDYLKARHNCGQDSGREHFKEWMQGKEEYNDVLFEGYNLAWRVIQKQPYLSRDQELAELIMSLLGTIIVGKDGRARVVKSKIEDESFLKTLMDGGELSIYSCGEGEDCLALSDRKMYLPQEKSWTGRVQKLLLSIQSKILKDMELSEDEKALLMKSSLPIYKVINVLTAYKHGTCPIDLYQISDIVALDLLTQFLKESILLIREGCFQLKQAQMFAEQLNSYIVQLDRVEGTALAYEKRASRFMEQELQLIQKIVLLEEQIAAELIL